MKPSTLNEWLTIGTNFGVIAGIIFLAMEVRQGQQSLEQSNVLSNLTVESTAVDLLSDYRQFLLENPAVHDMWLRGLRGDQLEGLEVDQFRTMCFEYFWIQASIHSRAETLGDFDFIQGQIATEARFISDNPGVRDCWDGELKEQIPAYGYTFATQVDAYILENQL